jgi:hypothetical protein
MTFIEEIVDQGSVSAESSLPAPPATTTSQHAEIARRSQAAAELRACDEQAGFARVEDGIGPDPPFRSPAQRFVLYSISHVGMPPIAKDPTNPGIRLYGLMESRDECKRYAAEVNAADPTCSLLITDTHRWDIAVCAPDRLTDPDYKPAKLKRIAKAHAILRANTTSEFKSNVKARATGRENPVNEETAVSAETREVRRALHQATWDRTMSSGRQAPTRLPGTLAMEDQRYAVVCFMHDLSEKVVEGDDDPEPAFMVLAAFGTDAECNRYIRNVAADEIQDHDMDIVEMRRWLHPEQVGLSEAVSTEYRHKELTKIMNQHKKDGAMASTFKKEQEALGRPVTITDIGADAETSDKIVFEAELFGDQEAAASTSAWDKVVEAALGEKTVAEALGEKTVAEALGEKTVAEALGEKTVAEAALMPSLTLPALPETKAGLRRMRISDLRAHARAKSLETLGNKNVLVNRLWKEIGR